VGKALVVATSSPLLPYGVRGGEGRTGETLASDRFKEEREHSDVFEGSGRPTTAPGDQSPDLYHLRCIGGAGKVRKKKLHWSYSRIIDVPRRHLLSFMFIPSLGKGGESRLGEDNAPASFLDT